MGLPPYAAVPPLKIREEYCMRRYLKMLPSLCIIIAAVLSSMNVYAERDAYSGEYYFHEMDSYTGNPSINEKEMYIGSVGVGNKFVFKDLDFGQNSPTKIELSYALGSGYDNSVLDVAIDGEENVVGTLTLASNGSWTGFTKINGELFTDGINGVHDIMFICRKAPMNLRSFKLEWKYDRVTAPKIEMTDRFGRVTENIVAARKINVTAARGKNTGKGEAAEDLMLIAAAYDSDGTMIENIVCRKEAPDGGETKYEISDMAKPTGTANIAAFFWNADFSVKSDAVMLVPYVPGLASDNISAQVSGARVKISGKTKSENVSIAVVPEGAELSVQNAVQLFEIAAADGGYEYTFKMNASLPTGRYTAYVTGSSGTENVTFDFMSMSDYHSVLSFLESETDSGLVCEKLLQNAGIFGYKPELFENMTADNKQKINELVKAVFADKPLEASDDYTPWTEAIFKATIPDMLCMYLKNAANAARLSEMLADYADILGINDKYYKKYYTSESKTAVAAALIKSPPETIDGILAAFRSALAVGYVNSAGAWGNVDSVIVSFTDVTGINTSVYKRLSNSDKVKICESFFGKNFESTSALKNHFDSVISGYKPEGGESFDHPLMKQEPGEVILSMKVWQPEIKIEITDDGFSGFSDLGGFEWAEDDINSLAKIGLIKGKSKDMFAPGDAITREEFTALIMRVFGFQNAAADSLSFSDADKNAWYAENLAGAASIGLINGIGENEFGIGRSITREELSTIVMRAVGAAGKFIMPKKSSAAFTDSGKISDWAYDSVSELARAEIVNGVSTDKFEPTANATRAEAAVILSRIIVSMK